MNVGVDNAGQGEPFQLRHQRVHPDAQLDVEHDRPVFDENVPITLLAIDRSRIPCPLGDLGENGGECCYGPLRARG